MKFRKLLFAALALAVFAACDDDNSTPVDTRNAAQRQQEALLAAMDARSDLSAFAAAFAAQDLSEVEADRLTVLAVKNDAMPAGGLTEAELGRHVLTNCYDTDALAAVTEVRTLSGGRLTVTSGDGGVRLNNVPIGTAAVADRSLFYVLDRPMPAEPLDLRTPLEKERDALAGALATQEFSLFAAQLGALDLADTEAETLTVFAVNNGVWTTDGGDALLRRQIVKGTWTPEQLETEGSVTALDGTTLVAGRNKAGDLTLNNVPVGGFSAVGGSALYLAEALFPADNRRLALETAYDATAYRVVTIEAEATGLDDADFEWSLAPEAAETERLALVGSGASLEFIAAWPGDYPLVLKAVKEGETLLETATTVRVASPATAPSENAAVAQYTPAPGQNIPSSSWNSLLLGAFGGQAVVKFDHTVINAEGLCDFRTWVGGAGACPCVVWVAYDRNGNGAADADEWYEIRGSFHGDATVDLGLETVTYFEPATNPCMGVMGGDGGLEYELGDGTRGYLNNPFSGVRWPSDRSDEYTLEARRLAWPCTESGMYLNPQATGWGYACIYPGGQKGAAIDIDWAVDASGRPVKLPGIDFVRVANALVGNNSFMGEYRADLINGIQDLHLCDGGLTVTTEDAQTNPSESIK